MFNSTNYKYKEFTCKCGCGTNLLKPDLLHLCELVRELNGNKPLPIWSGTRCKKHNAAVGGSVKSQHLLGTAADLPVDNPEKMYKVLNNLFLYSHGIGLYDNFIHVDIREWKARW